MLSVGTERFTGWEGEGGRGEGDADEDRTNGMPPDQWDCAINEHR